MVSRISHDVVVSRFQAILTSFDFSIEWLILGIGRLHVFKRKKALRELYALYIALWNLALEKSFPDDSKAILALFMDRAPGLLRYAKKDATLLTMRVEVYTTLLAEFKDSNFSEVASNFLTSLIPPAQLDKSRILKLSLHIRKIYTFIFDTLI